mgnify:CR=1 FL=1
MLTLLFDGIAYGMLLFILAVGLSVTMGLMNFINLAHGAFAMVGGYITVVLMQRFDVPFLLCLPLAFAGAAVPAAATPAKAANAAPAVPAPAAPATTVAAPPAASPTATPAPAPHSISDVVVILNATAGSLGKSWTLRGAALAVLGFISDLYEGALSIGLEAVSAMQQLKPLEGAIGNIAGNTKAISASMFFFGIGVIGTRRIKAKLEGRKG